MSLRYIDEPLGEEPSPAPEPRQLRPRYLPEHDGPPKRPCIAESTAGLPSYQQDDFVAGWVSSAWSGPPASVSQPPVSDHQSVLTYKDDPSAGVKEWSAAAKDWNARLARRYPSIDIQAFTRWYLAQDVQSEPDEPRERALQQRRNRNTGPNRDITRQKRPRRSE